MSTMIGDSSDPNPALAMTLAATAYCSDPGGTLTSLGNGWSAVWTATGDIDGNIAFIAYNGSNQYVVAIRGSILDFSWQAFDNWFQQDLNVFKQSAWTYPSSSANPMISLGSADGLNNLTQLVDSSGQTMYDYLAANAIGSDISIGVVGHSLGGNLATVYAPWLLFQLQQNDITPPTLFPVMTFAAPTAGNQAFADAFDKSFPNSWRYYNELDIVPLASAALRSAAALYPSPAPAASGITTTFDGKTVSLAEAIGLIADAIDVSEIANGSWYTQTNQVNSVAVNTSKTEQSINPHQPLIEQWFAQAAYQHVQGTYLSFFGVDSFTCAGTMTPAARRPAQR